MKIQLVCLLTAVGLISGCSRSKTGEESSYGDENLRTTRSAKNPVASPDGEHLKMSDLPPAVQTTIRNYAGAAPLAHIKKDTLPDRVIYEVSFSTPGLDPKIYVAEDGTIVKSDLNTALGKPSKEVQTGRMQRSPKTEETDARLTDLPPAVREALRQKAGDAKLGDVHKTVRNGQVLYELKLGEDGSKITVTENGTIVEQ